ncbi:catechol 1,2-dioxygenase [Zobellella denitrificans]|jgi:catechol 1,2-dioxygenase|uniref:catechol 1,2-dioxygenase n=1 Tax=Zobellella denitrificans TaxID=347534 RepID=A0A231MW64_9GAMM|nr:catechol 1,2-dioxygenase [Zobellella denitrificans]ATG72451.1 catechol 1,2-dioxygenase [Zobellella denitrificans]OXS14473.1 catechol 1,2-dioxygenase [Zobellella denitrificans]
MSVKTMHTQEVTTLLEKVAGLNQAGGNERVKTIVHRVMHDVFQLIEDLDITPEEFWSAVYYLNDLGKNGEAALLAPGLGMDRYLDIRQDAEDEQAGLAGGTPRTIEGPLYVAGAPLSDGFARMDDGSQAGETMILTGQVTDQHGQPLADAIVDLWHADLKGAYSYFDQSQSEYNLRRRIKTDAQGRYTAQSIIPSGYGCPPEGATQALLNQLGRHGRRPAHIHFFVSKPGYKHLTTQINLAGDEYTYDDFAFATREELVVDAVRVEDPAAAEQLGLNQPFTRVEFNIRLLATDKPELQVRHERKRALEGETA